MYISRGREGRSQVGPKRDSAESEFVAALVCRLIAERSAASCDQPLQYAYVRWHCLSNATCLIRPHLFYVLLFVIRIKYTRFA